jgi:hypothetical protein
LLQLVIAEPISIPNATTTEAIAKFYDANRLVETINQTLLSVEIESETQKQRKQRRLAPLPNHYSPKNTINYVDNGESRCICNLALPVLCENSFVLSGVLYPCLRGREAVEKPKCKSKKN